MSWSWRPFASGPRTQSSGIPDPTTSTFDEPDKPDEPDPRIAIQNALDPIPGEASPGITRRFDGFSITNNRHRLDVPKPAVNTTNELEALMMEGLHVRLRDGLVTNPSQKFFRLHSAILFETVDCGSGSSTESEMRYLPLVTTPVAAPPLKAPLFARPLDALGGRWRRRRYSSPRSGSSASLPLIEDVIEERSWPLEVTPGARRYIHDARARRSLVQTSTSNRALAPVSVRGRGSTLPPGPVSTVSRTPWPSGVVPVELFEMITRTLSPRDIRNMRLVCKEFDSKSSPTLFKEVVVPFTAGLYDMIEDDASARMSKDKAGASSYEPHEDSIYYRNLSDGKKGKHGLKVFQGFGPHMNKFGIRFEVTEHDLSKAPAKQVSTKHVEAYHGGYAWPPPGYSRFSRLAKLESSADETPRMTAALATLVNVREIGLSLDSGLGFLGGPDRSDYDMVFARPLPVFDEGSTAQRPHADGATQFWSSLRQSRQSFASDTNFAEEGILACFFNDDSSELPTVSDNAFDDSAFWPTVKAYGILGSTKLNAPVRGILYTARYSVSEDSEQSRHVPPISPRNLTDEQKQWILETGWAQSAFLDTYILALTDNTQVFHQVTKITISKMSSGLLSKLNHSVFWDALPNAENVTLLVSPDWRTVGKDDAGDATLPEIDPSCAIDVFRGVVHRVSLLGKIKRLRFGYTDGGEYGKGMCGRNNNLMPAPITAKGQLLAEHPDVLSLDHIEDLTLVNCWITPQMLKYLTTLPTFASATDKFLTFDSVSLTANTKYERTDAFGINIDGTVHTFREGCWPTIINDLAKLVQLTIPESDIRDPHENPTALEQDFNAAPYRKITLNSCGYTCLATPAGVFDQTGLQLTDPATGLSPSMVFRFRTKQLISQMLTSNDTFLGRILTSMPTSEVAVLKLWGLQIGWPEGQGEAAKFDGLLEGGAGRFSGCLQTV